MNPKIQNALSTFPPLYQLESVEELLTEPILSKLLLGFTTGLGQIPVVLYDRKKRYDLFDDPKKYWAPFCKSFRSKFGQEQICQSWDEQVVRIMLENLSDNGKTSIFSDLFECHAHMIDMAQPISVGGRAFAVLLGGQICSWKAGAERRMRERLQILIPDNTKAHEELIGLVKDDQVNNLAPSLAQQRFKQFTDFSKEVGVLLDKLFNQRRRASEEILLNRIGEVLAMDESEDRDSWRMILNPVLESICKACYLEGMSLLIGTSQDRFCVRIEAATSPRLIGRETRIGPIWEVLRHRPIQIKNQTWASGFKKDLAISPDIPCCIVSGLCEDGLPADLPALLVCIGIESETEGMCDFSVKMMAELVRWLNSKFSHFNLQELQDKARALAVYTAHDVKFPLHAAINLAEAIQRAIYRTTASSPYLRDNVNNLCDALHEASRKTRALEQEPMTDIQIDCEFKNIDICALIDKAIEFAASLGRERGIRAFWKNRPYDSIRLCADAEYFSTAIGAVLENAVKYSFDDHEVRVSAFEDDGSFVIRISNYGIGIPPPVRFEIFHFGKRAEIEDFYRGHRRNGVGFGLAITKRIIAAHSGTIDIDSRPPKGIDPQTDDYLNHLVTVTIALPM